ncbi:hypothetical protein ABW20_dc0100099 [Dactylellina cionopaga]|nr:hypothetical protein ABW20_dc0100099 [Dactylellina cionopaga]
MGMSLESSPKAVGTEASSPSVKNERQLDLSVHKSNMKYPGTLYKETKGVSSTTAESDRMVWLQKAAAYMSAASRPVPRIGSPTLRQQQSHSVSGAISTRQQPKKSSKAPRDHRPMYSQEEADAISYLRDSVGLTWKQVVEAWNNLFDHLTGQKWGPRTISGLQSHYYRMLGFDKKHGRRPSAPNPEIGLLKTTNRRYWWNYGSHPSVLQEIAGATSEQLKASLKQNIRRLRRDVQRQGRRQRKLTRRFTEKESAPKYEKVSPQIGEEDIVCPEIDLKYGNENESDSSLSSDEHSTSDMEGSETSIAPPPSSQTSAPTSPYENLDFKTHTSRLTPGELQNQSNTLPSFENLADLAGQGADGRQTHLDDWLRLQALHEQTGYDKTEPVPPRPHDKMAFSNILL